ncbi:MAG: polyphosphate--glucose phosphotransferase [Acidimicrobiales bacterium]
MDQLGIDIGGSGIKGAPVDLERGELAGERFRLPTPRPAEPGAVADVVAEVAGHFGWEGAFGCTFPGVVKRGVTLTAANLDPSWVGLDAAGLLEARTGCQVALVNDADAAGAAEMAYGVGRGRAGVVVMVTFGTGIGSAVFVDGRLVPNTELGHLELDGRDAEKRAADSAREAEDLSWEAWAKRVDAYLAQLETVLWPDLIVVGGGVSKKADKFLPLLATRAEIVPAALLNQAGIVGAAMVAGGGGEPAAG